MTMMAAMPRQLEVLRQDLMRLRPANINDRSRGGDHGIGAHSQAQPEQSSYQMVATKPSSGGLSSGKSSHLAPSSISSASLSPSSSVGDNAAGSLGNQPRGARRSSATQELQSTKSYFYQKGKGAADLQIATPEQPANANLVKLEREDIAKGQQWKSVMLPLDDDDDDGCDLDYDDEDVENVETKNCISSSNNEQDNILAGDILQRQGSRESCCRCYKRLGQCLARNRRHQPTAGTANGLSLNGSCVQTNEQSALAELAESAAASANADSHADARLPLAETRPTWAAGVAQAKQQPDTVARRCLYQSSLVANRRQSGNLSHGSETCGAAGDASSPIATASADILSLSANDSVAPSLIGGAQLAAPSSHWLELRSQCQQSTSRCSIQAKISQTATTSNTSFESSQTQNQQAGGTLFNSSSDRTRRHSSPQQQPVYRPTTINKQPSIEEQIKRLLDIGPSQEELEQRRTEGVESMKKSAMFGGGRDQQQQQQQQQYDTYNQQSIQAQPRYRGQTSGISSNDRMMIFMLASRSTQTNTTVERNARILKWLNNCKDAR